MDREPWKLTFTLDPNKIPETGYTYKEIIEKADKICDDRCCIKIADGVYSGHGDKYDFYSVCSSIRDLVEESWFRKCVKEMFFVDPDGCDDMIEHYQGQGFVFG